MNEKNYRVEVLETKIQKHSIEAEKKRTEYVGKVPIYKPIKSVSDYLESQSRGPKVIGYADAYEPVRYKTTHEFATVWGRLRTTVRCRHCQMEFPFEYEMTQDKEWHYWLGWESSLENAFRENPGIPPPHKCPTCGRYQDWMTKDVGKKVATWALGISWLSLIVLTFFLYPHFNPSAGNFLSDFWYTLAVVVSCVSGMLVAPLTALIVWGITQLGLKIVYLRPPRKT